ncbi:MAG: HyaD/HybD family hydrogenase maturation endopeptidase [Candidatus Omnitrophota bacterium]
MTNLTKKKKIVVLGIGNLLLQDEGIGIHVIEELKKEALPDNVEVVDGSVLGFDLLPIVKNCDKLIVVDAVRTDEKPGAIYKFKLGDIDIKRETPVSLHDIDFFQVLEVAKRWYNLPETELITVVPKETSWGMELSDCLKAKVLKIKQLVLDTIEKN